MMNLFKDTNTVELFNKKEYSEKYQREMTVAEWEKACELYKDAEKWLADVIGTEWTEENLDKILNKLRHANAVDLMENYLTAQRLFENYQEYIDFYYGLDKDIQLLLTLSLDEETNTIKLAKCLDVHIKGLGYAYEGLAPDEKYIVLDDELGLDLIYSK